jgi:probable addiction module antidote protein
MTRKPRSLSAAEHHDQLKMIASLNNALATGDTAAFVKTIGDQLRIQGMTNISQKTGLNRTTLYISFRGNMMPNIDRVVRALAALKLEIVVRPIGRS